MALGVRVGHGEDDDQVGHGAVADEPLAAVDDVVVAARRGPSCAAAAASDPASASVSAKAMSCSPLASAGNQRACCSGVPASVIGSDPSSWTARMSPVVAQARLSCSTARQTVRSSPPSPPCSVRERQGQDVVIGQQPAQVLGELAGAVDLGGTRRDPLVGQHADGVAEHLVLLAEAVGARGAVRGGHRPHRNASHPWPPQGVWSRSHAPPSVAARSRRWPDAGRRDRAGRRRRRSCDRRLDPGQSVHRLRRPRSRNHRGADLQRGERHERAGPGRGDHPA